MAYLHVVTYNDSGIKFYQKKNKFKAYKIEKDHYEIFDKEYDAVTLYKMLDHKKYLRR